MKIIKICPCVTRKLLFSKLTLQRIFQYYGKTKCNQQIGIKKQVTIFTSVVWYQDTCKYAVVISGNLSYMKDSNDTFIEKLISELIEQCQCFAVVV